MEIKEIGQQEVGMSFEPRTLTTYKVREGDRVVGQYEEISVYQKDGKTLVTRFGKFR